MKIRLKNNPTFIINVNDDFPLTDEGQWERTIEYIPFTKAEADFLFETDFTGVTKREDGLFWADESAMARARDAKKFEILNAPVEDPNE